MLGRPVDSSQRHLRRRRRRLRAARLSAGVCRRARRRPPSPAAAARPARAAELCPGLPAGWSDRHARAREARRTTGLPISMRCGSPLRAHDACRPAPAKSSTIVIPSRSARRKHRPRPASSAERRELLERRARQIAVHREAARAALARGDLDGALGRLRRRADAGSRRSGGAATVSWRFSRGRSGATRNRRSGTSVSARCGIVSQTRS